MRLILDDHGSDVRDFPDLMTERLRIEAGHVHPASVPRFGNQRHDLRALLNGNQRPLVFRMARLTAARFATSFPALRRLGMRGFRARRQRRFSWSFTGRFELASQRSHFGFEIGDAPRIVIDHSLQQRPKLGWQRGHLLGIHGRRKRHAPGVADFADFAGCAKVNSAKPAPPGCERLRRVAHAPSVAIYFRSNIYRL